jgi:uncharacterized protein
MKLFEIITILLTLALFACGLPAMAQSNVEGSWQGSITVPGATLRIVFNISKAADGSLKATMDSPDQGAKGIPIDLVTFKDDKLHIEMKQIAGAYDGAYLKEKNRFDGNWVQGGMTFPLVLTPVGASSKNAPAPQPEKSNSSDIKAIAGIWSGSLAFAGMELRVVFHLTLDSTGNLTATLDSPDQGVKGIPFDSASFASGHVKLTSKTLDGGFDGDLLADKNTLTGNWSQHNNAVPLTVTRTLTEVKDNRPQEPVPPFPYDTLQVTYANPAGGDSLAGTLTTPRTGGPFPAILLITGSGPQNRDETLMGHKPFAVLADYLTRRGIAVLRVDDRGIGKSTGNFGTATSVDFLSDVLAGVHYLKGLRQIDPYRIGLVGHSEGGLIAPMAAVQSKDVAFIVLMAGPGTDGARILLAQGSMIERASGLSESLIGEDMKIKEKIYSVISQVKDSAEASKQIRDLIAAELATQPDSVKKMLDYSPETINTSLKTLLTPWFRYFIAYDPKPTLMKVTCPVLAVNGEKDMQVPAEENLKAITEALKAAGNKDFETKMLPSLNHLFQTCKTGAPTEYSRIEETISPIALAAMGDWIVAHTTAKK